MLPLLPPIGRRCLNSRANVKLAGEARQGRRCLTSRANVKLAGAAKRGNGRRGSELAGEVRQLNADCRMQNDCRIKIREAPRIVVA